MYNPVSNAQEQIAGIVQNAIKLSIQKGTLPDAVAPDFVVEIPKDTTHGDFAVNVAMVSAKAFGMAPRKIAEAIGENLDLGGTSLEKFEIAGPGFLNFFLSQEWFGQSVQQVLADGDDYGRSDYGKGEKVMVEFVSANPTGPMHMGNARGGALGDGLAAALDFAGYDVTREFLINDAGNQIAKFGNSLNARYLQLHLGEDAVEFPEDGYHGDDIKQRAAEFSQLHGDKYVQVDEETRKQALVAYALPANVEKLRTDLLKYRITYDVWFSEQTLHDSGAVDAALELLRERGAVYEQDGALWYTASKYGCEKDEVLVRQNGAPTYFAADIAYHYNKFAVRGFDRVINIWGADHHGHVARLKGAMDAIGLDGSKLDIVLMQLVNLTKNGEIVRMSKRTGKSITLGDLLDEIPIDAARFFFNMREPNSALDFDLDLAVEQSSQNPVYYVQYAHARICSIVKNLASEGIQARELDGEALCILSAPEERELIRKLAGLPNEIIGAAKNYDPARITHYVVDVATLFHKFYGNCRVKGEDEALMQARLSLCLATKTVLKNVLTLLKIETPETM